MDTRTIRRRVEEVAMEIPRFPVTPHLPGSNMQGGADVWAELADVEALRTHPRVLIEEKIDGANVGIHYDGIGDLTVRNRDHHLKKGYQKKETPSKLQFRPLWGWVYDHRKAFRHLTEALDGFTPVVYGEWLYAEHTIAYDHLPDLFIGFDIMDMHDRQFLDPWVARDLLADAGFELPPRLNGDLDGNIHGIDLWPPPWGAPGSKREGVYVKAGDGRHLTHRAKYVRPGFQSREDFTTTELRKNRVAK